MGSASAPMLPTLASATPLPIAQLSPSIEKPAERYLHAAVILLWPFSSSTKQLSLLLSEPDFRLRGHKGQVKVTFHGASAERIAKAKIGIGDIVYLGLDGVRWEERDAHNATLTNCVDWNLVFSGHVQLEIHRNFQLVDTVQLDAPDREEEQQNISDGSISTPKAPGGSDFTRHSSSAYTWSSPAFSQSLRASFGPLSQPGFDPLAEEKDGFVWGIGRKRTKFGRPSSEWTFVDAPPSPTQDVDELDWDEREADRMAEDEAMAMSQGDTIPFTQSTVQAEPHPQDHEPTEVASPAKSSIQSEEASVHVEPPRQETLKDNEDVLLPMAEAAVSLADHVPAGQGMHGQVAPSLGDMERLEKERSPSKAATTPRLPPHLPSEISPVSPLEATLASVTDNAAAATVTHIDQTSVSIPGTASVDEAPESPEHREHDHDEVSVENEERLSVGTSPEASSVSGSQGVAATTNAVVEEGAIDSIAAHSQYQRASISPAAQEHDQYGADEDEESSVVESIRGDDADVNMQEATDEESEVESYVDGEFGYKRSQSVSEFGSGSYISEDRSVSGSYLESEGEAPGSPNTEQIKKEPEVIVLDSSDEEPEIQEDEEDHEDEMSRSRSPYTQDDEIQHDAAVEEHEYERPAYKSIPGRETQDAVEDLVDHHHLGGEKEHSEQQESPEPHTEYSARHGSPILLQTVGENQAEHELGALADSVRGSHSDQSQPHSESVGISETTPIDPGLLYDGASSVYESQERTMLDVKEEPDMDHQLVTPQENQEGGAVPQYRASSQPFQPAATLPTPDFSQEAQPPPFNRAQSLGYTDSVWRPAREFSVPISLAIRTDSRKKPSRQSEPPAVRDMSPDSHVEIEHDKASEVSRETDLKEPEVIALERVPPSIPEAVKPSVESEVIVLPTPDPNVSGLRSHLSYFAPLSTLVNYFNNPTDTISVVIFSTEPSRATKGPRDYFLTLFLTDPSMAGVTVCAQVFRKHKASLPSATRGDVVLLRNFKVQSADHSMMLLSMGSSSWAVFRQDEDAVERNGPPVEYGEEEQAYVNELRKWYQTEGSDLATKQQKLAMDGASAETSSVASSESMRSGSNDRGNVFKKFARPKPKKHRRVTIHELRHGRRYTEVGSPSDRESIHELRDGTVYAHL